MSNNLRILPTHVTTSNHTMSTVNNQSLSTALAVILANIEGLTASKASISEMCKSEHCHCLCLKETHIVPHLARPKLPGITLITERPHIKYGSAILIRSDLIQDGREATTPTSYLYLRALLTCAENQSWNTSLTCNIARSVHVQTR